MKKVFLVLLMVLPFSSRTQISVTDADMPGPGERIRHSITTIIQQDFTRSGLDTTWDFSGLEPLTQQVDTFLNVQETPPVYWLVFTPGIVSNLALKGTSFPVFPGISMTENYTFFKNSSASFGDLGFAFLFSGIPIMVKYDQPDLYYQFPCTWGSSWASVSNASLSVPGMGYYASKRIRNSTVDGYGTLITPFGTFETVRVKTELLENDSIFVDSLNIGFPFNQISTEYRWLAKGKGTPVLKIVQQGLVATATYQDIDRHLGIPSSLPASALLFPNPSPGDFHIRIPLPDQELLLECFSLEGKPICSKRCMLVNGSTGSMTIEGDPSGFIFVRITGKGKTFAMKLFLIPHH